MPKNKAALERTADLLDVHVVDMLAHVQALLRSVTQIQRTILGVRGVAAATVGRSQQAADDVQKLLARMAKECDALRDAIQETTVSAGALNDVVRSGSAHPVRRS
jgi:hypothetical protein